MKNKDIKKIFLHYLDLVQIFVPENLKKSSGLDWKWIKNTFKESMIENVSQFEKYKFHIALLSQDDQSIIPSHVLKVCLSRDQGLKLFSHDGEPSIVWDLVYGPKMTHDDFLYCLSLAFYQWRLGHIAPTIQSANLFDKSTLKIAQKMIKEEGEGNSKDYLKITNFFELILKWLETQLQEERQRFQLSDLKENLKKIDKKNEFEVISEVDLVDNKNKSLLIIGDVNELLCFLSTSGQDLSALDKLRMHLLAQAYRLLLNFDDNQNEHDNWISSLASIYYTFPFPILVLNEVGAIVDSNHAFSELKILPKECLGFKNHDYIETKNNRYKMDIREHQLFSQKVKIYYFIPIGPQLSHQIGFNEELAIITSSLAHELNNPIAGVLSGLEILGSFAKKGTEEYQLVSEMKATAMRCKNLIRTFLGFTKAKDSYLLETTRDRLIQDASVQAVNLVKIRVLELQGRLIYDFKAVHPFGYPLNESVFTMLFYLLLTEILNEFLNEKFLESKATQEFVWRINLNEDVGQLRLEFNPQIKIEISHNKFIKFLLSVLKLEVDTSLGLIKITRQQRLI